MCLGETDYENNTSKVTLQQARQKGIQTAESKKKCNSM